MSPIEPAQNRTRVAILTSSFQIKGYVELMPGARITDLMNGAKDFVAVTDAGVFEIGSNTRHVVSAPFINVCRTHVQIIAPL